LVPAVYGGDVEDIRVCGTQNEFVI
jgi:hypothetical protein